MMSLKERLLYGLERSQEARRAFVAGLSDGQRSQVGTYEKWCAKDELAHMAYWVEQRAARLAALGRGDEPPPSPPHFEQANVECFERYCNKTWDGVEAFADLAHSQLVDAVSAMDDDRLAEPASESQERPLWEDIIGTGYTHVLMHISGHYTNQGQPQQASRLWQEWGVLVGSLNDEPVWQGLVRYNVACGLALSGNPKQAALSPGPSTIPICSPCTACASTGSSTPRSTGGGPWTRARKRKRWPTSSCVFSPWSARL